MFSLVLINLVTPEVAFRHFRSREGLKRLGRIQIALEYVARKEGAVEENPDRNFMLMVEAINKNESIPDFKAGAGIPYDFLLKNDGIDFVPLDGWEFNCASAIFRSMIKKLKETREYPKLDPFLRGFDYGLNSAANSVYESFKADFVEWLSDDLECPVTERTVLERQLLLEQNLEQSPASLIERVNGVNEQLRWLDGCRKGLLFFRNEDGTLSGETPATRVHSWLLYFARELKQMDSVEDMYSFLSAKLGEENFRRDLDGFRVLCGRIGLRGKKYNKYKRRN